jgi:hypothetical protein
MPNVFRVWFTNHTNLFTHEDKGSFNQLRADWFQRSGQAVAKPDRNGIPVTHFASEANLTIRGG